MVLSSKTNTTKSKNDDSSKQSLTLLQKMKKDQREVEATIDTLPLTKLYDQNDDARYRDQQYQRRLDNSGWKIPYTSAQIKDFKYLRQLLDKENEYVHAKSDIDYAHRIPYIQEKDININGAKISTNLLDSLFKYADMYNVPYEVALGLPMQETALGYYPAYTNELTYQDAFRYTGGVNPTELLNYHQFFNSPYSSEFNALVRQSGGNPVVYGVNEPLISPMLYNEVVISDASKGPFYRLTAGSISPTDDVTLPLWKVFNAQNDQAIKRRLPILDKQAQLTIYENPYQAAFQQFFKGKYNPGDSKHTSMVIQKGKELLENPKVQKVLKEKAWKKSKGGRF